MSTVVLPRTFTVTSTGARPFTVNKVAQSNRYTWAAHTKVARREWAWLAKAARVPRLNACTITVTPLHRNSASPQDVAACAPEAKAAIDGLVDARVLPDDTAEHVLSVRFLPPRICGVDGMELQIHEVLTAQQTLSFDAPSERPVLDSPAVVT